LDSEEDDGKEAVSKRPRRSHPTKEVIKSINNANDAIITMWKQHSKKGLF
jgi:hypothetical protein